MSGNQGETKSSSATKAVAIPQLTPEQSRALAQGRTIGGIADREYPTFCLITWTPLYIKNKHGTIMRTSRTRLTELEMHYSTARTRISYQRCIKRCS